MKKGRVPIDIAGHRFGKLVAVKIAKTIPSTYWECKCDCGKIAIVDGSKLRSKATISCGCARSRIIDLTGQRFGRLTVLSLSHVNVFAYWNCICSCGTKLVACSTRLKRKKRKNIQSCGCVCSEQTGMRAITTSYRKMAIARGYPFLLSIEQVEKIVLSPCGYCGGLPANKKKTKNRNEIYHIIYNGIDRLDNSLGYTPENVIPCCKWCNIAKRERSLFEFKQWAQQISQYLDKWPK